MEEDQNIPELKKEEDIDISESDIRSTLRINTKRKFIVDLNQDTTRDNNKNICSENNNNKNKCNNNNCIMMKCDMNELNLYISNKMFSRKRNVSNITTNS